MVATTGQRTAETIELSPRKRMGEARSYEEWSAAAMAEDERTGAARWRAEDRSSVYDYEVIRHRLEEIRAVRASGDPHRVLFYLNEGIHGNTGGMGSGALYRRAHFGTKHLVTEYTRELAGALEDLEAVDEREIPLVERLEFFRRASHCFGRTALMYSGGGTLGLFHVGVSKALHQQGLLPNVLSGASAGSIVAAFIGTCDDDELDETITGDRAVDAFVELAESSIELSRTGARMHVDDLRRFVEMQIPDLTFAEAFEKTGRQINITISPRQLHQQSRLMNAVTSPNVMIRETVMASCAIPGIFPAVTLAAKDRQGKRVPYVASRQWVDGSVTSDLPARRLSRLYGVNHFITSQTNPVTFWSLSNVVPEGSLPAKILRIGQNATRDTFRATYPMVMRMTRGIPAANLMVRMAYGVAVQDYTADINIVPRYKIWNPAKWLALLSEEEARWLIDEGEASTWPAIERVRNTTRVSRTLDRILDRLEERSLTALGPPGDGS